MMTMMASTRTAGGAIRFPPSSKQFARSRHLAAVDGATAVLPIGPPADAAGSKSCCCLPVQLTAFRSRVRGAQRAVQPAASLALFRALLSREERQPRRPRRFAWPSRASRRRNPAVG
ncbi:hypothetical protein MTO96_015678 [Rhipicephalus appendiculatus]